MNLNVQIHKIKSIEDLKISLPLERGLYAITGQNGSGKSTIVTCASRPFFRMRMDDYFGETENGAFIKCELNGVFRHWTKRSGVWAHESNGVMEIKGFYEGSLIFGNRFRNTSYEKLKRAESINQDNLVAADEFIRKNLGLILQKDSNFYEKLWYVNGSEIGLGGGYVFYYEKSGKRISQFHMSTGENLLISILNSINIRNKDRESLERPCLFFLDEIELALHPSSLKQLILFLHRIAEDYNYAIYFSTHSIELISGINPDNIFYLDRHADGTVEILNPCYPAYATKFLYDQSGYDKVILVEDDLAKEIVRRVLVEERLLDNRLVHILPAGGFRNVLNLAADVTKNNLLGKKTSLSVILDLDIRNDAYKEMAKLNLGKSVSVGFLPFESLEKYLRNKLFVNVDHSLFRFLNNYLFQRVSLDEIIGEYKTNPSYRAEMDSTGKTLFGLIDNELRVRNRSRADIVEMVIDYVFKEETDKVLSLVDFLKKEMQ